MWSLLAKRGPTRSASVRLREIESECNRGLEYAEHQLDKLSRTGPWQRRITVDDADIVATGWLGAMVDRLHFGAAVWRWLIPAACGALAVLIIGALVRACT